MSLQPGINPLEASSMEEDRKRLERTMAAMKFQTGYGSKRPAKSS